MTSALIAAVRDRLLVAGYSDLPTPLHVAGVAFDFTGVMRGRDGRALEQPGVLVDRQEQMFEPADALRRAEEQIAARLQRIM